MGVMQSQHAQLTALLRLSCQAPCKAACQSTVLHSSSCSMTSSAGLHVYAVYFTEGITHHAQVMPAARARACLRGLWQTGFNVSQCPCAPCKCQCLLASCSAAEPASCMWCMPHKGA